MMVNSRVCHTDSTTDVMRSISVNISVATMYSTGPCQLCGNTPFMMATA